MTSPEDGAAFIGALEAGDLAGVARVPKADLHSHMDLGGAFEGFTELWGAGVRPPPGRFDTFAAFQTYILDALDPILSTSHGTKVAKRNTLVSARDDGVVVLEASIDDGLYFHFKSNPTEMIDYLQEVVTHQAPNLDFRPELGIARGEDLRELHEVVAFNLDLDYFRSLDLYGDEEGDAPAKYRPLFERARSKGLKLKAHVGEYGAPETIRATVEALGLDEVQHGITAATCKKTMRWLRDNAITLHVCPTSNLRLGRVRELRDHPIKVLFHEGVRVTINTDDRLIFGASVSQEFLGLYQQGVLSAAELNVVRENGLRAPILGR